MPCVEHSANRAIKKTPARDDPQAGAGFCDGSLLYDKGHRLRYSALGHDLHVIYASFQVVYADVVGVETRHQRNGGGTRRVAVGMVQGDLAVGRLGEFGVETDDQPGGYRIGR